MRYGVLITMVVIGSLPGARADHPVLDHRIDTDDPAKYEAAVERAMAMTEEELLAFIPDRPFTAYCECPNCYGGVQGNHIFTWSIDAPEQMTCKFCGTVYPSDQFPEDRELTGQNALGEAVTYRYHLGEETGVPHFLTGNLRCWRRTWLVGQCLALGRAYHATGAEKCARRAALILDRAAQLYPHYPVMQNQPRRFSFCESQQPPWRWDSGRWGYFHNEIPRTLVQAYDLIHDSPSLDALGGRWLILTHGNGFTHGYEIDRVEEREGVTAVVLTSDYGLRVDGDRTQEVFYPQRTVTGANTFAIPQSASLTAVP